MYVYVQSLQPKDDHWTLVGGPFNLTLKPAKIWNPMWPLYSFLERVQASWKVWSSILANLAFAGTENLTSVDAWVMWVFWATVQRHLPIAVGFQDKKNHHCSPTLLLDEVTIQASWHRTRRGRHIPHFWMSKFIERLDPSNLKGWVSGPTQLSWVICLRVYTCQWMDQTYLGVAPRKVTNRMVSTLPQIMTVADPKSKESAEVTMWNPTLHGQKAGSSHIQLNKKMQNDQSKFCPCHWIVFSFVAGFENMDSFYSATASSKAANLWHPVTQKQRSIKTHTKDSGLCTVASRCWASWPWVFWMFLCCCFWNWFHCYISSQLCNM